VLSKCVRWFQHSWHPAAIWDVPPQRHLVGFYRSSRMTIVHVFIPNVNKISDVKEKAETATYCESSSTSIDILCHFGILSPSINPPLGIESSPMAIPDFAFPHYARPYLSLLPTRHVSVPKKLWAFLVLARCVCEHNNTRWEEFECAIKNASNL
jgi:hypothetical protein